MSGVSSGGDASGKGFWAEGTACAKREGVTKPDAMRE